MQRTLVNLDPEDKAWLDREAKTRQVSMTELVRQAVHSYRVREESRGQDRLQLMVVATHGARNRGYLAWRRWARLPATLA